ncbi:MAG: para-aminobenzoate synthetase / 4-amino-4-deoxychorismate [Geobacteraceae bacterium]|nr:MAG: para-aminobenzoate synthetase / 4-amino-4-deoxychorismate [Geobacteraceae bacterium]
MNGERRVLLESYDRKRYPRSYCFTGLVEEIAAHSRQEVIPALRRVEAAAAGGMHAAGFVSFEAAAGFNRELVTHPPGHFPLLWFGIYTQRSAALVKEKHEKGGSFEASGWTSSMSRETYAAAIDRIKEYIASGDTYQTNFTLRQRFRLKGEPFAFYRNLCRAQRAPFCAFLDIGRFQILSASPELFFELRDGLLTARPMKGTATRGRWHGEDEEVQQHLKKSEKERAENLMIVDLLRNDMGMVSETGSVAVQSMFDVEILETVHQMTSTITSRVKPDIGIIDLFQALFPCGSVTGAPKKRTMEIIRELEDAPRGLYTGCIGYVSPGGEALFSVAIRTIVIDGTTGLGELGVGSGITWDSEASAEYDECLAKGRFACTPVPEFQLIETLLFEKGKGYFLLERHLARLYRSAAYFGFNIRLDLVTEVLKKRAVPLTGSHKVRLLLSRKGAFSMQTEPVAVQPAEEAAAVTFAESSVDSQNPFLYHKTTNRPLYAEELARQPSRADVIFFNERGEVTEGANNNIVAKIGGELITPPLPSGLLPGTFREELLESHVIKEKVITREELELAEEIYLINSVRKWRRVKIM